MSISVKKPEEIENMRKGGQMLAEVLKQTSEKVAPGVTPKELSAFAGKLVKELGGEAAFQGHQGFPDPICISVNDEVVHGIPGNDPLEEGDVVGLDFGVRYKGLITDGAVTVPVGKIDADAKKLLDVTQSALAAGIFEARVGNRVGDISAAIEKELKRGGLAIIEELVGHGVGYDLWEEPQIPNYGKPNRGPKLVEGMTIAIEPMATLGRKEIYIDATDGWTVRTEDGSLSAQFEHTILITDGDAEILTKT